MPKIPEFASDQEESDFWDTHSAADFEGETQAVDMILVDHRPREGLVSLRLDPQAIERLIAVANSRKIGYRTLLENWIMERLAAEPELTEFGARPSPPLVEPSAPPRRARKAG